MCSIADTFAVGSETPANLGTSDRPQVFSNQAECEVRGQDNDVRIGEKTETMRISGRRQGRSQPPSCQRRVTFPSSGFLFSRWIGGVHGNSAAEFRQRRLLCERHAENSFSRVTFGLCVRSGTEAGSARRPSHRAELLNARHRLQIAICGLHSDAELQKQKTSLAPTDTSWLK